MPRTCPPPDDPPDHPCVPGKTTSVPVQIAESTPSGPTTSCALLPSLVQAGEAAWGSRLHRSIPEYPIVSLPFVTSCSHSAHTRRRFPAHTVVIEPTCCSCGSGSGGKDRH